MNNTNDLTINTEKVLLNFCRNLRIIYIDELLFIEMYTEYMLSYKKTNNEFNAVHETIASYHHGFQIRAPHLGEINQDIDSVN